MKVRWTAQSVRMRITPTELKSLECGQKVETEISFPGDTSWKISIALGISESHLTSNNGAVCLFIAPTDLELLLLPEVEGVYSSDVYDGSVRFVLEKDFPCIHPSAVEAFEPVQETFSAPAGFDERKKDGLI